MLPLFCVKMDYRKKHTICRCIALYMYSRDRACPCPNIRICDKDQIMNRKVTYGSKKYGLVTQDQSIKGFSLIELMIVVAIIGLLTAVAVPNFIQYRNTTWTNRCITNLQMIDAAKEQYALENNLAPGATAPTAGQLGPYFKGGTTNNVICPSASVQSFVTSYSINAIGTDPTCLQGGTHVLD